MDVSKFFVNWTRLWLWITVPLLLRLVLLFGSAYLDRPQEEERDKEKIYADSINKMELIDKQQQEILAPFYGNRAMPFQEYFLTQISMNSKRADVQVTTECSSPDVKGSPLQRNRFKISGGASSLYSMTLFLDYMMSEPTAVIKQLNFKRVDQKSGTPTSIQFDVVFEHVEMKPNAGKV